jgi:hypothetical protein
MSASERLSELLDYIEQVEKLKRKATFVVPSEFFLAFQGDMQGLPCLEFNQLAAGDDVWLRVPRLKEIPPPELDGKLAPWVSLSKSPDKPPELREEISPTADPGEPVLRLKDHPKVQQAFDWYRDEMWTPWAAAEQQRRKTIGFYNKLFSLQQIMATEGAETSIELVWGLGVCLWRKDGRGRTVRHPLVSQTCEVSIDELSFVLEVRPRDVDPVLELDCYAELEVPGITQLEAFWRREIQDAENRMSPFEASTFERTLRAAVTHLDPSGVPTPSAKRAPRFRSRRTSCALPTHGSSSHVSAPSIYSSTIGFASESWTAKITTSSSLMALLRTSRFRNK